MPYGIYDNIECEYGEHDPFTPQEHQEQVLNYFIKKSPFKGLCLFHRLGSGKSCSSIITSDQILRLREANSDIKAKKLNVNSCVFTHFLKGEANVLGTSKTRLPKRPGVVGSLGSIFLSSGCKVWGPEYMFLFFLSF